MKQSAALDLPKLIFQSTTLVTYLHHGFPTPLIYFYSHLLFLSWLFTVYRYRRFHSDHHFIVVRLFYLYVPCLACTSISEQRIESCGYRRLMSVCVPLVVSCRH